MLSTGLARGIGAQFSVHMTWVRVRFRFRMFEARSIFGACNFARIVFYKMYRKCVYH